MKLSTPALPICLAGTALILAQPAATPAPDPLIMADGSRVATPAEWREKRRPELLDLLTREMYGVMPARSPQEKFSVFDQGTEALGGKAIRKQVTILVKGDTNGPKFDLLLYTPKAAKGRVPTILGLNFYGNHAIAKDPGVRITANHVGSRGNSCVENGRATEACRGINASQWPVETMIDKGYALATFYLGDIDPDTKDGFDKSLKAFYPELQNRGDNFSTIAEWAWAFSRAMDYLETDRAIDPKRVAVFGWSRLGKAALWAAATDERFQVAISNESGAGGAKLFHRGIGESVERLNTVFPHWYDQNFRKYNGRDTALPFDSNEVIALIAPRAVYIGSAEQDAEADPAGEFAGAKGAEPVYKLLGKDAGLPDRWPAVNQSVGNDIGYHVRTGKHDVQPFDWEQYLKFLDRHFHPQGL